MSSISDDSGPTSTTEDGGGTATTTCSSSDVVKASNTGGGGIFTKISQLRPFQFVLKKAFQICDKNNSGRINKDEFYVGVILLHLNLAKYAGPAACYPPTRKVCEQMFDAADSDKNDHISQQEFEHVLRVLFAQILFRMVVYYGVLILFVPEVSVIVVDYLQIPNDSYMEMAAEQTISLSLFFLAIPIFWDWIDAGAEKTVEKVSSSSSSSSTPSSHSNDAPHGVNKTMQQKKDE
mmetsp:Transcript_55858/g.135323  ORF Transcript_55858/g.135323 Transcript_55858/m.135323 type:complete len:235 (-) Transcript_55858:538-1242(-)